MMVEMDWCRCCEEGSAGWELAWRPLRRYRRWLAAGPDRGERVEVCEGCARWLAGLVVDARGGGESRLFGQPGANGRHLVFDDQCAACCESPAERAYAVRWASGPAVRGELFLCTACARWLLGLARSGRTVRGMGERYLDGAYGAWPHPRLRGMRTWARVRDAGATAVLAAATETMGLEPCEAPGEADAVLVEATPSGQARALAASLGPAARRMVVLAAHGCRADVAGALELGAAGWVTVPPTPQQLTAALARLARGQAGGAWDPATLLPAADPTGGDRPWLWMPVPGGDGWELAWLVRRFCRGYDTVAAAEGGIAVVPVVPPACIGRVRERLQEAVGGAAAIEVRRSGEPPARRFEAAG